MDIRILSEVEKRGHEQVTVFHYPAVGLRMIVAIHSTALGPSLGGCRMRLYESHQAAIDDVLRLAEGMTYKSSIAGLDLGGGKSCIIADSAMEEGRRELFLRAGECVENLGGRYITAEDMGTSVPDIMAMREKTSHVSGVALEDGGSGDPSPWTAEGVYHSIRAACERVYDSADLSGRHISIQGAGHVGIFLLEHLRKEGAKVTVSDPSEVACKKAKDEFGAEVVGVDEIYDVDCDVYSPCAIGQTVNPETIPRLKCKVIAGAANNILSGDETYPLIEQSELLYLPDFVINSGGVMSCAAEFRPGGYNRPWLEEKVKTIYHTIHRVLDESDKRDRFTEVVALELARERVREAETAKSN